MQLTYEQAMFIFAVIALLGPTLAWKMGRISGAEQMRRDLLEHPSMHVRHADKQMQRAA